MKKELGGARVGSESKMDVELHGFNRSTHDISRVFKTDQAAGPVIPCFCDIATNGTDYYIDLESKIFTLPTNGPIFGIFKHQVDIYRIPLRLYIAELHNNALGTGLKMSQVKLPVAEFVVQKNPNGNSDQVSQDSLMAYLGLRGLGTKRASEANNVVTRKFQALFELAYWDTIKNYYANKQEEIGYVIGGSLEGTIAPPLIGISMQGRLMGPNNNHEFHSMSWDDLTGGWEPYETIYFTNMQGGAVNEFAAITMRFVKGTTEDMARSYEFILQNYKNETAIYTANSMEGDGAPGEGIWSVSWSTANPEYERLVIMQTATSAATPLKSVKNPFPGRNQLLVKKFELSNIDEMRERILKAPKGVAFNITEQNLEPYASSSGRALTGNEEEPQGNGCWFKQAGLALKTYLSDRFNNWLSTEWLDGTGGINEITAVEVKDGVITMDALIMQKKVFDMLNRIAVSGGSYNDWQEAVYGQKTVYLPESPVYEGGMSSEIYFDEVVGTSASDAVGVEPLGTLAGKGTNNKTQRGGHNIHVHIDEPSMLLILESITPRVDYSQGNKWFTALETMDDLHKPNLDGIGFQELITEEMAAFDTVVGQDGVEKFSAGKQPAWIQYQTNVDEAYGDFSAGEPLEFMALNREYERDSAGRIADLTTYIDPVKYNTPFADTTLEAKNFWVQMRIDVKARRVMSANQIPNL